LTIASDKPTASPTVLGDEADIQGYQKGATAPTGETEFRFKAELPQRQPHAIGCRQRLGRAAVLGISKRLPGGS
jgi:hypothetical protein